MLVVLFLLYLWCFGSPVIEKAPRDPSYDMSVDTYHYISVRIREDFPPQHVHSSQGTFFMLLTLRWTHVATWLVATSHRLEGLLGCLFLLKLVVIFCHVKACWGLILWGCHDFVNFILNSCRDWLCRDKACRDKAKAWKVAELTFLAETCCDWPCHSTLSLSLAFMTWICQLKSS